MPDSATRRRFGRRGNSIPGSRFVRGYCGGCGEPIRIVSRGHIGYCEDCGPKSSAIPRRGRGRVPWDDDAFGYGSVAMRALDECRGY